jgi:GT2 family glycosyltransferase
MMIAEKLPLVGLITIWYRATREMGRFVANLEALQFPHLQPVFVIHSQTPEEIEQLKAAVPKALVIQPGKNLGCSAGWNLGIRSLLEKKADYIGIWNADVYLDPECMQRLVTVMHDDLTIGAVSPLLFYSDEPNKVQMYGGSRDVRTGIGQHDYNGATDLTALPPTRAAQYLDGGTMLVRADVLRRIGGFDEKLFMYIEDVDISLRLQQAGYCTVAVRDAWAWHSQRENKGSFPPPHEVFYTIRNRFYFVQKHAGRKA